MKARFLKLLILINILIVLSCNDHMKPCNLGYYPGVMLVGFDSTEVDSIQFNTYNAHYGFDSLINSKKLSLLSTSFHKLNDSFYLTPFLYTDTHVNYCGISIYNFDIKFGNNRVLKLSNFSYDKNECDAYGYRINQACYCDYLGCMTTTTNCKNLTKNKKIYISP